MQTTVNTTAALLLLAMTFTGGCSRADASGPGTADEGSLTIMGSDTMVHLVTAWTEAYMKAHPKTDLSVTGGGSGNGIAAIINGSTPLCMASRKVKDKEREQARARNVTFKEFVVARDGIAIVVNPENPVSELTMDQLRQIFNGTLRNWKQVGGPDQAIQALSRESNSGTYVYFNTNVLKKDDYGREVRLMPSNATIVQSVSQDRWSIGYVGLSYSQRPEVKVIAVKPGNESSTPVVPSLKTVSNGSYPIWRPLHLYTNGEPIGLTKAFIDFAFSDEGQQIAAKTGSVPLRYKE